MALIPKYISLLHHLNELGGSLADPMKKVVGLKGMRALALEINFDSIIFKISSDINLPIWKNMQKLSSLSDVLNLTHTSSEKLYIRNFISLLPFIVYTTKNSTTIRSEEFLIQFITSTNSFDLTHKGE